MKTKDNVPVRSRAERLCPNLLKLAGVLLAVVLLALNGLAEAGQIASSPKSTGVVFNPQKNFTITKIQPDAARWEVKIFFSHPVPLDLLTANLQILPRIKLDWRQSEISPEGVLTLRGDFRPGAAHYLSLKEGQELAGRTYVPTVTTFVMPDRPATLEFVENKRVIERDSRQLLHVRVVNCPQVWLEGLRVPPILLPQALAAETADADLNRTREQLEAAVAQLKTLLPEKDQAWLLHQVQVERQLFPAVGEKNRPLAVSLPLSFRQGKEAGALMLVRVKDQQENSRAATALRLFRITDLGLTYKVASQGLLLWVTSLKSGTPVPEVRVWGITRQMEVFPLGQTDKDGVLTFTSVEREGLLIRELGQFKTTKRLVKAGDFSFILAARANDVSYLEVRPGGHLKPEGVWQVGGQEQPQNLKGHIFTERGVYRPGEKVFFKGTVREFREGAIIPPQQAKVVFEIFNPKQELVFTKEADLSDFGTAAGEMATEPHWPLGSYTLVMRFAAQAKATPKKQQSYEPDEEAREKEEENPGPQGEVSTTFQVQEFRPPRHFAEISFERFRRPVKDYVNQERQAEFVRIIMTGGYYAGGPVKHGQVRWKIRQAPTQYQVQGYDNFTFGYTSGRDKSELLESGQTILDEHGKAVVEFPLDRHMLAGRQGLSVTATVLDFDGRAASASKDFQVDPDFLVGISRHKGRFLSGEKHDLQIVLVDRQGKKVKEGNIQAEVLERSYSYVAKRNEKGELYWDHEDIWSRVFSTTLTLKQGQAAFPFDCGVGGHYLLAFTYTDPQGRSFSSATLVKVQWEYLPEEERARPYEPLAVWAEKETYRPGETARLNLTPKTAISYYLVTVERDGLLFHQVLPGGPGSKTLDLAIKSEYSPNVYVSVLGLTPRGDFPIHPGRYDSEAPSFVWGNLKLPVFKEVDNLVVKISPQVRDLKARPGDHLSLDLTVTTPQGQGLEAELAVAVVDEAVLALTAYKTPTLEKLTRFDVPLGVFTSELRTLLVHQTPFYPTRVEPLTGGGGLSAEALSKLRKRFEAVAYFNPRVRTDSQGKARVTFILPDNITSYRVFVVALDRTSRFASEERQLLASKDFYLEPGLPAFFNRGDRFRFQVAAMNATDQKGPVNFSLTAQGPLNLVPVETTGQLNPKDSLKFTVSGEASAAGRAQARFRGEFKGHQDEVELSLRVTSGLVRHSQSLMGTFSGSTQVKIPLPPYLTGEAAAQVNPEEVKAVLSVAGTPFFRLSGPIQYLLNYPYGCVEQTSSGILGLAALRGLIQGRLISGIDLETVDNFLKGGLNRLIQMQTSDGGFSYWPGRPYIHSMGTIYAMSAMSVAKAKGFPVPENTFKRGLEYLVRLFHLEKTRPQVRAFVTYLLALNGKLNSPLYQKAMRDYPGLSREGRLLLLLAAKHAGLRSPGELRAYLKPLLLGRDRDQLREINLEEDFDAHYRGPALALLAARAIMPEDPLTQEAALFLLGGLGSQGFWTSTSDTGWALLALGEFFRDANLSEEPGLVKVMQPGLLPRDLKWEGKGSISLPLDIPTLLKNPQVQLIGGTARTWLYQVDLTYPRLDLVKQGEERGFKVSKQIKNTDGSDVIKVGDLVKVSLMVHVQGNARRYIVLDDPLPAGLVGVNTAFKTEEPLAEGSEARDDDLVSEGGYLNFWPHHFEIREDRVLAFRDYVYPGTYHYAYYARAVCEGDFLVPSTHVQAMYQPRFQGFTPQSRLIIKGR
uniref:Alpha-2-macroglobulin family protein n=1 Tax=Desulfobacca acetoxidans TaxID=60893 RepID=A0A7C5ALP2_9BACT